MQENQKWDAAASDTQHTNVNETPTNNKSYLVTHKDIPHSPLTITGTEDGYFIRAGSYKLTESVPTEDEAHNLTVTHRWDIIISLIVLVVEKALEDINSEKDKDRKIKN